LQRAGVSRATEKDHPMKRTLITVILFIVTVCPAPAADLLKAPPPPQAPVAYLPTTTPVYNWGGVYVGINGGYGSGNSDWTGGIANSGSFDTRGFVLGGTAGLNVQWEAFVFGVETDFDYAPFSGNGPSAFCANCSTATSWLGTTRVRAGYAADRILIYGTTGLAYGDIQANANSITNSSARMGWTAGAGIEDAFADNWTARIEYLFVSLQNGSCTTACGSPLAATQSVSLTENLIRAGVDYKFRP
jgi:outer membrane immunogenic protein